MLVHALLTLRSSITTIFGIAFSFAWMNVSAVAAVQLAIPHASIFRGLILCLLCVRPLLLPATNESPKSDTGFCSVLLCACPEPVALSLPPTSAPRSFARNPCASSASFASWYAVWSFLSAASFMRFAYSSSV